MIDPDDPRFHQRLAAQGIHLVDHTPSRLVAECITCCTRWEITADRLGLPHEDDSADWWWCPHGCNRAE